MTEAPMIALSGVAKSFGRDAVLRGIDMAIGQIEVVCLIGPSGSGKSTAGCAASISRKLRQRRNPHRRAD